MRLNGESNTGNLIYNKLNSLIIEVCGNLAR